MTSVRSPKGLVGISTEEASPGTTPSSIEDQIAHWRNYARAIIKAEGKDKDKDKKTIDYVTLARRAPPPRPACSCSYVEWKYILVAAIKPRSPARPC